MPNMRTIRQFRSVTAAALLIALFATPYRSAQQTNTRSADETAISKEISGLRDLPDDVRAGKTKELALRIRQLPMSPNKVPIALSLANLSTEGDFGRDTLQEVTTSLASAVKESPAAEGKDGTPAGPYIALAQLARYEHMQVSLNDPQLTAADKLLVAADASREKADFTLTDLDGTKWNLKSLRGKVVLVNFWATWCPPCRKELPDLQTLYNRFKDQGFVILGISDEEGPTVKSFLADKKLTYPIMLDPGRKVNELFQVNAIPKSFVYDRNGKLVAQSIDMRTQQQFLQLLAQAGLK